MWGGLLEMAVEGRAERTLELGVVVVECILGCDTSLWPGAM
jgi:hypothetical protein